MRSLAYWIQRADFSATDYEPVDAAGALRVFEVHPWHDELRFQAELESGGREYCPPGIGFVDPDGPILHVCPTADGRTLVHYHAPPRFGLPPVEAAVHTREGLLRAEAAELIHYFFHGQHDWILQKLARA
jgi:hypothetical protein